MLRSALFVIAAMLCAWPASTRACDRAPEPDPALQASAATSRDSAGRAVAPIMINGQGPFRFIIDTGANRSVISAAVAQRLGLAPTGRGVVHAIDGPHEADLVNITSLTFGDTHLSAGETPVIDGPVLAGEEGLLGVDGMAGRVLRLDFENRCAQIYDAASAPSMAGWTTMDAQLRFGTLIIAEGIIQGVRVNVLIDTGASVSLANTAFRDSLERVRATVITYRGERAFTAGRPVIMENSVWTPRLRIGDAMIGSVNAYVADFHIFELWGLADEPTVLVGMDVLRSAREMAIDYQRGRIHFRNRPRGEW